MALFCSTLESDAWFAVISSHTIRSFKLASTSTLLRPKALIPLSTRAASRFVYQTPRGSGDNPIPMIQAFKDDESVKYLQDPDVAKKLADCKTLSDVNPSDYDAIFYPGGTVQVP